MACSDYNPGVVCWRVSAHAVIGALPLFGGAKVCDMPNITSMSELANAYEERVNEAHPDIVIFGMVFLPGRVLREVDPVAFRCGYLEYADALGINTDELDG